MKFDAARVSKLVIIVTTCVIIIYDVFAYYTGVFHGTISGVIWDWSHKYPVIPLLAGVLIDHLFITGANENR